MERLIFGLISLLGLGIMIVGGTMQSSFIAGAMFIGGMNVFGIFGKAFIEYNQPTHLDFTSPLQKSQK